MADLDFSAQGEPVGALDFSDRSVEAEQRSPTALDYLKQVGIGLGADTAKGIGWGLEKAGIDYGTRMRQSGDWLEQELLTSMTPGGRRAAATPMFEGEGLTDLRLTDKWGQSLAMGSARSLPQTVMMAPLGGPVAAGVARVIPKAAQAATGLTGLLARNAPGGIGFGLAEGLQSGALNAEQTQSQIETTDPATLAATSPRFRELLASNNPATAQRLLAKEAAGQVFRRTVPWTGAIGALTGGGAMGELVKPGATSILKGLGRGALEEAAQEFPQSGGEQYIQNVAERNYVNPETDPLKQVVSQAFTGGAIGGATGGAMGGAAHIGGRGEDSLRQMRDLARQMKEETARQQAERTVKEVKARAEAVGATTKGTADGNEPIVNAQANAAGPQEAPAAGTQEVTAAPQADVLSGPAEVRIFGKPVADLTDAELADSSQTHPMSAFREAAKAEAARRAASSDEAALSKGGADSAVRNPETTGNLSQTALAEQRGGGLNIPGSTPLGGPALDTTHLKSVPEGVVADAQARGDLGSAASLLSEGYGSLDVPTRARVFDAVKRLVGDGEIFGAIIKTIPVDVVNELAGKKFAPDLLLSDPSVFVDALSANDNLSVRGRSVDAIVRSPAFPIAEVARVLSVRRANDGSATAKADERDGHAPPIVLKVGTIVPKLRTATMPEAGIPLPGSGAVDQVAAPAKELPAQKRERAKQVAAEVVIPEADHDMLRTMAANSGHLERGGRVMRELGPQTGGEVTGVTSWVGQPEWAKGLSATPADVKDAVEKAISGKPLGTKQKDIVKAMLAEVQVTKANLAEVRESLAKEGIPTDAETVAIAEMVDRAEAMEPGIAERLAMQHDTDAAYMAALVQFLKERENAPVRKTEEDHRLGEEAARPGPAATEVAAPTKRESEGSQLPKEGSAPALDLTAPTEADLKAKQDAIDVKKADEKKSEEAARAAREKKEIAQRSAATAGEFTLSPTAAVDKKQQAEIDAKRAADELAGQKDIFATAANALRTAADTIEKAAKPSESAQNRSEATTTPGEPSGPATTAEQTKAPYKAASPWYSDLSRKLADLKRASGTAQEWKAIIAQLPGVKKDEIEWSGILEWLEMQDSTKKVEKADVLAFLSTKAAYNPSQLDLAYDQAETRPGTTEEQKSLGIAALKSLFGGHYRGRGALQTATESGQTSDLEGGVNRGAGHTEKLSDSVETQAQAAHLLGGLDVPSKGSRALTGTDQSTSAKRTSHAPGRDAEILSDAVHTDAFREHGLGGLDVPLQAAVRDLVFAAAENDEVLKSVIPHVPVDVVNMLRLEKLSPEMFLHDAPMFVQALASGRVGRMHVGFAPLGDLVVSIASFAAKVPSVMQNPVGVPTERGAALGAGNGEHTGQKNSIAPLAAQGILSRDRAQGASLLASALWKDFTEHQGAELIGQQVASAEDLALLAQVLRDPRFETLRFFFTKGNDVVGHTGMTSRLPGAVAFATSKEFREAVKRNAPKDEQEAIGLRAAKETLSGVGAMMRALEADGYWVLHNHPSGSSVPSRADIRITKRFADILPGFRGHVIIDQDEYSTIGAGGETAHRVIRNGSPRGEPELRHDALSQTIDSPGALARVASTLKAKSGFAVMVSTGLRGKVIALAEIPEVALSGSTKSLQVRAMARVRRFARMTGSPNAVFVISKNPAALDFLIENGLATDVTGFRDPADPFGRPEISRSSLGVKATADLTPKTGVLRAEQMQWPQQATLADRIDAILRGESSRAPIYLGETPAVLTRLGMPKLPVGMDESTADKAMFDHGVISREMKVLADAIADPVFVVNSESTIAPAGSLVVVTDLVKSDGRPVIVGIHPGGELARVAANVVASVYPKDNAQRSIVRWVQDGLRYVNNEKRSEWQRLSGVQFPGKLPARSADSIVLTDAEIVKADRAAKWGDDPFQPKVPGILEQNKAPYDVTDTQHQSDANILRQPTASYGQPPIADTATTGDERDSLAANAQSFVRDMLHSDEKFNWWHKTIGTQQHKALSNRDFQRVYDESQAFLTDVSKYANEAADMARDLLPKIDSFADFGRKSASKDDIEAVTKALYTGTLWGDGNPLTGRVWTDEELRTGRAQDGNVSLPVFTGLNDRQAGIYRQTLASVTKSLDEMGKSIIHRLVRTHSIGFDRGMGLDDVVATVDEKIDDAVIDLSLELQQAQERQDEAGVAKVRREIATLQDTKAAVHDVVEKTKGLQEHGYFPAMRFGRFAIHVVQDRADGGVDQRYFGTFENQTKANLAARELAKEFPDARLERGVLSVEQSRLFQGLSLDALETFAEYITGEDGKPIARDPLVQGFLKAAVGERSALKRHIHRKGVLGYSDDLTRVLASFTVSSARAVSSAYHGAEMLKLSNDISAGDVKDEAIKLVRYLQDPQEEAHALRGFLFAQFLGGSIAHGLVNMTQPFLVTGPYLTQYTSTADATAKLTQAAVARTDKLTGAIRDAYQRAKQEGVVAPQEIHQLRAETGGLPIAKSLALRKLSFLWGSIYSITEQFNRSTTFIAAYRIAVEKGIQNPYAFAVQAVNETQFVYNKGNRPNWARGPVGATIFCVDDSTEALTQRGWLGPDDLMSGDMMASFEMTSGRLRWMPLKEVHTSDHDGEMVHATSRSLDMLMTPDHRVVHYKRRRVVGGKRGDTYWDLDIAEAKDIPASSRVQIPTAAEFDHVPSGEPIRDELAPVLGWVATEGYIAKPGYLCIYQNEGVQADQIRADLRAACFTWTETQWQYVGGNAPHIRFFINATQAAKIRSLLPCKQLTPELLMRMTKAQIATMVERMIDGDGSTNSDGARSFIQNPGETLESFQMALTILGKSYSVRKHGPGCMAVLIREPKENSVGRYSVQRTTRVPYKGRVWCPIIPETCTWVARRNGMPFITHNTFKQFSISYLELSKRMFKKDRKAFALMVLMLLSAAGAEGLPFSEDAEDLIDTIGQWMGFATNTKKSLRKWVTAQVGPDMAQVVLHGISGLPWMPVDVSVRMGFQNLIPGTSMLKLSEENKARDVVELAGPVGQFVPVEGTMMGRAIERISKGDLFGAVKSAAPVAVQNVAKGVEMLATGQARDTKGKKITDVSAGEAVFKMAGLQPATVARESAVIGDISQDIAMQKRMESEIAEQWARGIIDAEPDVVRAAMKKMHDWNLDNQDLRVRINAEQIRRRVRQARMSRSERFIKGAAPEIRGQVRRELRE